MPLKMCQSSASRPWRGPKPLTSGVRPPNGRNLIAHTKTQPRTSGLMRLDKRLALLDGRHALIEHRGVELPIVAHAVEDF